MQIIVTSRMAIQETVKKLTDNKFNVSVISIGDPSQEQLSFPTAKAVLHLSFHDIDAIKYPSMKDTIVYTLFNKQHASDIILFVKEQLDKSYSDFVLCIHCQAGISRSQAVAQALDEIVIS